MISAPIVLDGKTYPHIHFVSIKRSFEVMDGPNAGRSLAGTMLRDVVGTYYNYSVEVDADDKYPEEYDEFYEDISAPVDSHVLTIPYGQTTATFDAYATNGKDSLVAMMENQNRWGNLTFNFIAMEPKRT